MTTKLFDRETMLDLTVNFIPLFIILFFIVAFAVFAPFGVDAMATGIQYVLLIAPFVFLAVLTYISARAIETDEAGTEASEGVLPPGQTMVDGVEPHHHDEAEELGGGSEAALSDGDEDDANA